MRNVRKFEYDDGTVLRIVMIDGEPWWVLADVCAVLEIVKVSQAAERLDPDEKGTCNVGTLGGPQDVLIVSEPGLYKLIMTSRKPLAKQFDRWVRHEVLPAIRRTGRYQVPAIPQGWQPFLDRVSLVYHSAPPGFFSIFKEMADVMVTLINQGAQIDANFVPDISVGRLWATHWENERFGARFGERKKYPHNYPHYFPQAASNPQHPYCYPDAALPEFRRWMREYYLVNGMPAYLKSKAKQGALPPSFVSSALTALAPIRVQP